MVGRTLEGSRIRSLRLQKGLQQRAVAEACGISPSYLNLIEHNRRPVAGALLTRIAGELDVPPGEISDGIEAALVAALDAVAGEEAEPSEEFASRFPNWARLLAEQSERLVEVERTVATLGDRMAHDPYLSASLHNVLSTVTSIRSTSAILTSGEAIEPEWQARFHRNIHEDSQRLTEAADGLVNYLEADGGTAGLPVDEVEGWLAQEDWRVTDATAVPTFQSASANAIADRLLERARSDAVALPDDRLIEAIEDGVDPVRVASRTGVLPDLAMRRIAQLSVDDLPSPQTPGLVVCDASGTLTFRKPTRGFEPQRFEPPCAMWPLFEALQRPGVPIVRTLVTRGRDDVTFQATAYARMDHPVGYDLPGLVEATMLVVPSAEGDGLGVGMSCRVCAEPACPARREASMLRNVPGSDI